MASDSVEAMDDIDDGPTLAPQTAPRVFGPGGDTYQGADSVEAMNDIDDFQPKRELPDGITKHVVTEAPADASWKKPKVGDEVMVHYVGTLEADGKEFDSSRKREKPLNFTLGKGQVIKGWDLGVATMKKGEIAKFTLAPDFAYGEEGSPPNIPPKATLVFEIELISWSSQDDLFGDDGVIKTLVVEGSGWKKPKGTDEVLLSLKAETPDGTVIEERNDFEYTLHSDTLGMFGKACDKALVGMLRGESVKLKCSKDYAYGDKFPNGATIRLTLHELCETKDVSFNKDGSVMKKQMRQGEGFDMPKDTWTATLKVEAARDVAPTSPALPVYSEPKVLEFRVGDGWVCDALECAVLEMKKGERAVLRVAPAQLAADPELELQTLVDSPADRVIELVVELESFEKATETWNMSEDEKVNFADCRKGVGSSLFKRGRVLLALQRYKKVSEMFNYIDNFKEANKATAKQIKKACELNKAACFVKLQDFSEAKKACEVVLKDEPGNIKAIFRRGQAELGLKNFGECTRDCKRVLELDPKNLDARALAKEAAAGQREEDKKSKGMFSNMCNGLGKGPIPEPYKRPLIGGAADDEKADVVATGAAE